MEDKKNTSKQIAEYVLPFFGKVCLFENCGVKHNYKKYFAAHVEEFGILENGFSLEELKEKLYDKLKNYLANEEKILKDKLKKIQITSLSHSYFEKDSQGIKEKPNWLELMSQTPENKSGENN